MDNSSSLKCHREEENNHQITTETVTRYQIGLIGAWASPGL